MFCSVFVILEQFFILIRVLVFCFLDFALVATINEKDKNETEDDGN